MSEPTRMQRMSTKSEYRGLVGIVNVPYLVLEPTHNKQKFANEVEQKKLVDKMSDYMEQYLFECAQLIDKTFWKKFGYLDDSSHLPIDDHPYNRVRLGSANIYAQCDECLKWRQLVLHERYLIPGIVADVSVIFCFIFKKYG